MVNSVVYHPCTSRLASRIHLSYFLYLNACWIFSNLYIPPFVLKSFKFMLLTFLENGLNRCIFMQVPVPHSELQPEIFENLFPPRRKGWRKLGFALSKFNQKIWRWLGTLVYLYFAWFVIFLNVIALQFCK